jgi:hypothetical protein
MKGRKLEPPFYLDLPADEALARFIQTKPEEVEPPSGRPRKAARPKASSSDRGNDKGRAPKAAP